MPGQSPSLADFRFRSPPLFAAWGHKVGNYSERGVADVTGFVTAMAVARNAAVLISALTAWEYYAVLSRSQSSGIVVQFRVA